MKEAGRYMEILLVVFREQNSFGAIRSIWLGMVKSSQVTVNWILKSQSMISFMITTRSLNSRNIYRILKQWRHDLSGKHLRDRYCMDIIWCLCGGQNSWFCKASLRICYVSLFECKGPWMLKTVINCHVWNRRYKTRLKKYHMLLHYIVLLNFSSNFCV